jgi:hypothetical protein
MTRMLVGVALTLAVLAPAASAGAASKTIAVVTHGDVRAVVSARKTSDGRAPTAAITVTGYRSTPSHRWVRGHRAAVAGTFFWKTVTAPHAVCRIRLSGSALSLSLLVTPSIGCSTTRTTALG